MRNGTHRTHRIALSFGLALVVLVSVALLAGTSLRSRGLALVSAAPAAPTEDLHVCATCAYTNVQAAVDAANPGDVIKVAAGVYTGVSARPVPSGYPIAPASGLITQVVYISKTVTVRGGYTAAFTEPPDPDANPTTLDAEGQGRVICIIGDPSAGSGQSISPTVEGLRITGGDATGLRGGFGAYDAGGGIYVTDAAATIRGDDVFSNTADYGGGLYLRSSNATVSGNTIVSNTADTTGGGVYFHADSASFSGNTVSHNAGSDGGGLKLYGSHDAMVSGNIVELNTATRGGGLLLDNSHSTIVDNAVISNTATYESGGISLRYSDATLIGNTVISNATTYGGGGVNVAVCDATLIGNTIISNTSGEGGGGIRLSESDSYLANNVVIGNRAGPPGGGIYVTRSLPRLLHTTVARNTGGDGSGIYVAPGTGIDSMLTLTNTILVTQSVGITVTAGNTAILNGVLWDDPATGVGGAGTITVTNAYTGNPAFAADGYHLGPGSAAIDQAVDAGVDIDIDLDLRPIGAGFDLGADEAPLFLIVTPAALATLVYTDRQGSPTTLAVPAGAVTATTTIQVAPKGSQSVTSVPMDLVYAGHALDLDAYQNGDPVPGFTFQSAASLTIEYSDADVAGLPESTLALYRWTGSAWEEIGTRPGESFVLDAGGNRLTAYLLSLSRFALFGAADVPIVGLSATNDSPTELGNATTFTATVVTGTNVAYTWAFGDGDTGNGAVVTHVYTAAGRYTAAVSAINSVSGVTATSPASVTINVVVGPGLAGTLVYTDTQGNPTVLDIPSDAVSETATIAFTPLETVPVSPGLTSAGHAFDLSAYRDGGGQTLLIPGFAFQEAATLTVRYSDADVARIDESTLALYRFWTEGTLRFWERVGARPGESQALDVENNVMTAWILGLSRWRGMGEGAEHWIFLPVVLRGD